MAKKSLLLVDADPRSLRVLEVSLRKAGYSVATCRDGKSAVETVELSQPDLILSDTRLPGVNGFELVEMLRANSELEAIPFMFLSSDSSVESKVRGLELGVEDYLTKPIYIKEIITRINLTLQRQEREGLARRSGSIAKTRFTGSLGDMGLVDLLQTIDISRKSGVLELSNEELVGTITFRDGQLVDAELGHLEAESAIYRLLLWNEGAFEIDFRPVKVEQRIRASTQAILMEGMRRIDEWGRLLEQIPSLDNVFEVSEEELVERLAEIPDEINGILRHIDGRKSLLHVVDACQGDDLETLTAITKLYFEGIIFPTGRTEAALEEEEEHLLVGEHAESTPSDSPVVPRPLTDPPPYSTIADERRAIPNADGTLLSTSVPVPVSPDTDSYAVISHDPEDPGSGTSHALAYPESPETTPQRGSEAPPATESTFPPSPQQSEDRRDMARKGRSRRKRQSLAAEQKLDGADNVIQFPAQSATGVAQVAVNDGLVGDGAAQAAAVAKAAEEAAEEAAAKAAEEARVAEAAQAAADKAAAETKAAAEAKAAEAAAMAETEAKAAKAAEAAAKAETEAKAAEAAAQAESDAKAAEAAKTKAEAEAATKAAAEAKEAADRAEAEQAEAEAANTSEAPGSASDAPGSDGASSSSRRRGKKSKKQIQREKKAAQRKARESASVTSAAPEPAAPEAEAKGPAKSSSAPPPARQKKTKTSSSAEIRALSGTGEHPAVAEDFFRTSKTSDEETWDDLERTSLPIAPAAKKAKYATFGIVAIGLLIIGGILVQKNLIEPPEADLVGGAPPQMPEGFGEEPEPPPEEPATTPDEPAAVIPTPEDPTLEDPTLEDPALADPTLADPSAEDPLADPVAGDPTVDEPAADEPAVDEPAVDEPAVDEPVADDPEGSTGEEAVAADPEVAASATRLSRQALAALNRRHNDEAAELAQQAVAADQTNALGWLVLGAARGELRDADGSRAAYQNCVDHGTGRQVRECRMMLR